MWFYQTKMQKVHLQVTCSNTQKKIGVIFSTQVFILFFYLGSIYVT